MDVEITDRLKPDIGKIIRYGPSRQYCPHLDRDSIIETDVLILGSGAAGLFAALRASKQCRVMLVSKSQLEESNTRYAQGGIAGVFSEDDSLDSHIEDTLEGGYNLCRAGVVKKVVEKGPQLINDLVNLGARFDTCDSGKFTLTREGGHKSRRVLHALGDQTGLEIEQTLIRAARANKRIKILENTFAIDLLIDSGNCIGALVITHDRQFRIVSAKSTVIATGGLAQVYRETSNPEIATGDGIAMAYRAGARLEDMEFVQFHPTTLYLAGAPRFLITEATRGEGAHLVNLHGERFVHRYHPAAELAPRDIVSRAILDEQRKTRSSSIFLDLRHLGNGLQTRFPKITSMLAAFDLNISKDLIPVCPSAHYSIGGISVGLDARTSLGGLFACGEVAATGFHGANRLGSNSLLESVVFGDIAGRNAAQAAQSSVQPPQPLLLAICESGEKVDSAYPDVVIDVNDARNSLKSLMWRSVGIVKHEKGMNDALTRIKMWARYLIYRRFADQTGWELQNMITVSRLIVDAALTRTESRGVHFRKEFQKTDLDWQRHIYLER